MKDFNLEQNLNFLKDFQRDTVDHVYKKLYLEAETDKFLIADEVGLGKTMVARGIIAKIIDRLQKDNRDRIDIIYICSNSQIARQNINRLNLMEQKFSHSSRITLLPLKIKDLNKNQVNFISFTPGTSFQLKSSGGIKNERALIYYLLKDYWFQEDQKEYIRFFQCGAGEGWENYLLHNFREKYNLNQDIDQTLRNNFIKNLKEITAEEKKLGDTTLKRRFKITAAEFKEEEISDELSSRRYKIIGSLREILAKSCINSLNAELVILDEFQKFKFLLAQDKQKNKLFNSIFKDSEVKTLLLSATPYKMYTLNHEVENHYQDFIDTMGVLFNSKVKEEKLKKLLNEYKNSLYSLNENNFEKRSSRIEELKFEIEELLKNVMVRNERVKYTKNNDAMIKEKSENLKLAKKEIKQFLALNKITQKMDTRNNIEYWKSSPYLLSFMESNYKLKENFNYFIKENLFDETVTELDELFLKSEQMEAYKELDPANARLNNLISKTFQNSGWKLIWMPSSFPYYKSTKYYREDKIKDFSKELIFSSWQVVPRMISSTLSYAVERKMTLEAETNHSYSSERKLRSSLLNFTITEEGYTGMPVFNLIFPFKYFAEEIKLLDISRQLYEREIPNMWDVLEEIKKIIKERLNQALKNKKIKIKESSRKDESWYWIAPLILEADYYQNQDQFLKETELIKKTKFFKEQGSGFKEHFEHYLNTFNNLKSIELGSMPNDLLTVLAKTAAAAPGIVLKRSLDLKFNHQAEIKKEALELGFAFRNLFNRPENITLISGLKFNAPYWQRVLDYSLDGNLQSVMDEYLHILHESMGLNNIEEAEALTELKDNIFSSLSLQMTSLNYDELVRENNEYKLEKNRLRCHYALKFGKAKNYYDQKVIREGQVREAFNSPFKPFVLATTSIGQEGLDFHQYCRSIIHWNLPGNPVDLEQREGRIHRYKAFVIRKNLAAKYREEVYKEKQKELNKDLWEYLFDKAAAERNTEMNDLEPYWIFENDQDEKNNYNIERHIPKYPMSRESAQIDNLKKSLAVYRMAFGQARQEDLLDFIKENLSEYYRNKLMDYRIDLAP